MLKILSGVVAPTHGRVVLNHLGQIACRYEGIGPCDGFSGSFDRSASFGGREYLSRI
ncbi:hypothetical protein HGG75_19465 [Ochrobactrum pseudogrignonense]|nr:hypothetical protein [Brucella pseudogrignonensis]